MVDSQEGNPVVKTASDTLHYHSWKGKRTIDNAMMLKITWIIIQVQIFLKHYLNITIYHFMQMAVVSKMLYLSVLIP